eukprot:TRINITY_DN9402_c0_g1_i1.p1 TRINITY_DN9402_c0_g1~~TRINITY_DN9402_c0_g1_i1.p1  ORF type:complete len:565 (+),score=142.25 TRINITY_DN9402_c0_g1_i1:49-1743(+)
MADNIAKANEFKDKGNKAFIEKNYSEAIKLFTSAIELNPNDHVFYSNRSGAYASDGKYEEALKDAEKCIEIKSDWAKGYSRKATALVFLGDNDEAIEACKKGLELEPGNVALQQTLETAKKNSERDQSNFSQTFSQICQTAFSGDVLTKVRAIPETRPYADQPDFIEKIKLIQQDPSQLQAHMSDERVMKYLIASLNHLNSAFRPQPTRESNPTPAPKPKEEPPKPEVKTEPPKPELPAEKVQAEEWKNKGNAAYKAKNFTEALEFYTKAFELDNTNMTYLTNRAAVHFEMQNYERCVEDCLEALEVGKANRAPFENRGRAWYRIGNAKVKQEKYTEAIEAYNKSLLEHRNSETLAALRKTEKTWEEIQRKAYINPELAIKAKDEGNDHFKNHRYPQAVESYSEAIRRSPDDPVLYSNRAAAYTKLLAYPEAIKDCEKAIQLDNTFIKAYIRKGHVHLLMKEYHKCMEVYDAGLKIDPNNQELKDGKQKTLYEIANMQNQEGDEDSAKRALNDPEIRSILSSPEIQQVLQDLKRDPASARHHLSNPDISAKLSKLVAAGIIRMG